MTGDTARSHKALGVGGATLHNVRRSFELSLRARCLPGCEPPMVLTVAQKPTISTPYPRVSQAGGTTTSGVLTPSPRAPLRGESRVPSRQRHGHVRPHVRVFCLPQPPIVARVTPHPPRDPLARPAGATCPGGVGGSRPPPTPCNVRCRGVPPTPGFRPRRRRSHHPRFPRPPRPRATCPRGGPPPPRAARHLPRQTTKPISPPPAPRPPNYCRPGLIRRPPGSNPGNPGAPTTATPPASWETPVLSSTGRGCGIK